jgi:hypothetical protein
MDETQEERGASSGQGHQETRKAAWTSLPRTVLQPSSIPEAQDYTFQCASRVSVGTLHGRISIPYQSYDKHIARIRQGATIGCKSSGKPLHRHTDCQAAPTRTYWTRTLNRYTRANKAQETQAQEERQRLRACFTKGPASANRVYSQWSFAEVHALISYKAALSGSLAIKVDADDTSKACPMCGHTADANRPGKGLLSVCQNPRCGYTRHADLIGARNVTMRTLLVRQD